MTLARYIALPILFLQTLVAQSLVPRLKGKELTVQGLNLNFIEGKALDRLRNGQSVSFDFHLQVFDGVKPLARSLQRFILSYDLWEETFSAVQLSQSSPRTPVYSTARLKSGNVATWCLGRMMLPIPTVDNTKPLTMQLEIRSLGSRITNPLRPQGSVDLGVLVEIFSRPPDPKEARFTARSETFTLGALASP